MLTKVKMPLSDLVVRMSAVQKIWKLESRYSVISDMVITIDFLQSAALALDQSTLDVDQVENLIKFCPTKEEMELLKVHISTMLL